MELLKRVFKICDKEDEVWVFTDNGSWQGDLGDPVIFKGLAIGTLTMLQSIWATQIRPGGFFPFLFFFISGRRAQE